MDRVEWQKKHQEECYLPAAKAYLEEILQDVSLRAREIHKELTGQVDAFLQSLCVLQEIGKLGVVRTVSISFPYTSLVCGNPYFLFEVYPGEPFLDEAVVIREFPVSWMFSEWEDFLAQVKRETGECGMNAVIRMPYIKSQSLGTARMVVSLMATLIKYHLYGLEETESYRKILFSPLASSRIGRSLFWRSGKRSISSSVRGIPICVSAGFGGHGMKKKNLER